MVVVDKEASGRVPRVGSSHLLSLYFGVIFLAAAPLFAGLVFTGLASFGLSQGEDVSASLLTPWKSLALVPGLARSMLLSFWSGLGSAFGSLLLSFLVLAHLGHTRLLSRVERVLLPLISLPHAALAIGLAFLIAPSGLLTRMLSPWASGWTRPPDYLFPNDEAGLALILGLTLKEVPFLLLMAIAAHSQIDVEKRLSIAASLGYSRAVSWSLIVFPEIYRRIRWPVYVVIAYSMSVVDMAIILGPSTPPTLAVSIVRWANDPELALRLQAAAGAVLQLALVIFAILLWRVGERLLAIAGKACIRSGSRRNWLAIAKAPTNVLAGGLYCVTGLAVMTLLIWSFAKNWRFPASLPSHWSLDRWGMMLPDLLPLLGTTTILATATALISLVAALILLEAEKTRGFRGGEATGWLFAALVLPQLTVMLGAHTLFLWLRIDGSFLAVIWSHLIFTLPYMLLVLNQPYKAFDERYIRTAQALGHSRWEAILRVKLPMLMRPLLLASAVGFAVSVGQYIPTLFAGAGRVETITTEAVALASGYDRRTIALLGFLQAILPLIAFGVAIVLPKLSFREAGMIRREKNA